MGRLSPKGKRTVKRLLKMIQDKEDLITKAPLPFLEECGDRMFEMYKVLQEVELALNPIVEFRSEVLDLIPYKSIKDEAYERLQKANEALHKYHRSMRE